jgi:serine/alanine adding enzyme
MDIKITTGFPKNGVRKWADFVNSHPQGTVFQSPEIFNLFETSEHFDPVLIVAETETKIAGLLLAVIIREFSGPFSFLSSRTVVYGGPLLDPELEDGGSILGSLLEELINQVKNRSVFIQFRNFSDQAKNRKIFEDFGFNYLQRLNYLVDTTSETVLKTKMSASKLRQVRKGLGSGASIGSPANESEMKEFYGILHSLYKRKVKKPLPSYSFFRNFYLQSSEGKLGMVKLVKYRGKVIGGILSPVFNNRVIYEWYVCGLDQEYKHQYPSVLATWAAIEYALQNNINTFDFMGVGVPGKDYGVREFKSKFGGDLVNFGRFGRINNPLIYAVTEIGFNLLALFKKI